MQQIKNQLNSLEEECMIDFMALNSQAMQLYDDISKTEAILNKVGNIVNGFQDNLEHITQEVKDLQSRSENYNNQLASRKKMNKLLSNYLDNVLLTKDFVDSLCNDDIEANTKDYLEKVEKLDQMVYYAQNPPKAVEGSKSLKEIQPEIEKVKNMVCNRSFKFILSKMNNLRKPHTNFQIYQESILLKYKGLMAFLKIHSLFSYQEVCDKYCEIMNNLYSSKLHQYFKDTWKLI